MLIQFFVGIFYFIYLWINKYCFNFDFSNFSLIINDVLGINVKKDIINYLRSIHSEEIVDFILLFLFNEKNSTNIGMYNDLSKISLVHLVVVSGFHISALTSIFNRIKIFKYWVPPLIILFFGYVSDFSASIVRVLFVTVFSYFKTTKDYKYYWTIFLLLIINPFSILNIGLAMSFLSIRGLDTASKIKTPNKCIESFLLSFFTIWYISPYIAKISGEISIWAVINSFLFTPIFIIIFFSTLIFSFFPNTDQIFQFIIQNLKFLITQFLRINVMLNIEFLKNQIMFCMNFIFCETIRYFLSIKFEDNEICEINYLKEV